MGVVPAPRISSDVGDGVEERIPGGGSRVGRASPPPPVRAVAGASVAIIGSPGVASSGDTGAQGQTACFGTSLAFFGSSQVRKGSDPNRTPQRTRALVPPTLLFP